MAEEYLFGFIDNTSSDLFASSPATITGVVFIRLPRVVIRIGYIVNGLFNDLFILLLLITAQFAKFNIAQ